MNRITSVILVLAMLICIMPAAVSAETAQPWNDSTNSVLVADMADTSMQSNMVLSASNHNAGQLWYQNDTDSAPFTGSWTDPANSDTTINYAIHGNGKLAGKQKDSKGYYYSYKSIWEFVDGTLQWDYVNEEDYYSMQSPFASKETYDNNTSYPNKRGGTRSSLMVGNKIKLAEADVTQYPYFNIRAKIKNTGENTALAADIRYTDGTANASNICGQVSSRLDAEGWSIITMQITPSAADKIIANNFKLTLSNAPDDLVMNISKVWFSKTAPDGWTESADDSVLYADMSDSTAFNSFVASTNHVTGNLYYDSNGNPIWNKTVDGTAQEFKIWSCPDELITKTGTKNTCNYIKLFKQDTETTFDGSATLLWDNIVDADGKAKQDIYPFVHPNDDGFNLTSGDSKGIRITDRTKLRVAQSKNICNIMPSIDIAQYPVLKMRVKASGIKTSDAPVLSAVWTYVDSNNTKTTVTDAAAAAINGEEWQVIEIPLTQKSGVSTGMVNRPEFSLSGISESFALNIDKIWFAKAKADSDKYILSDFSAGIGSWKYENGGSVAAGSVSGVGALHWNKAANTDGTGTRLKLTQNLDLSDYYDDGYINIWAYNAAETGKKLVLIINSQTKNSDNKNGYYRQDITIDWSGWKLLQFKLSGFQPNNFTTNVPANGHLSDIYQIHFQDSGYDNASTVNMALDLYISSIFFTNELFGEASAEIFTPAEVGCVDSAIGYTIYGESAPDKKISFDVYKTADSTSKPNFTANGGIIRFGNLDYDTEYTAEIKCGTEVIAKKTFKTVSEELDYGTLVGPDTITDGDNTVTTTVTNRTSIDRPVFMVVAVYDKTTNELVSAKITNTTIAKGKVENVSGTVSVTDSANQKVKAFLWDSSKTMKPLLDEVYDSEKN